ncbi:inner membrane protein YbjM [Candidatus Pantoea persica]|uniref:inner membrane protein YbjM n=1 Tax=Candidatus Pantoea persica TaxID=2518128 RepID=UPI00215DAA25|nr:inner membrane protein YbjM [Candidatus Pantoea persica]
MPQRSLRWMSAMLGVALYSLVFIYAQRFWLAGWLATRSGQPELLLFLLPGAVMALLHAESLLKSTLLMALWGTLLPNGALLARTSLTMLSAWSLSALFWAGSGALLLRIIWR